MLPFSGNNPNIKIGQYCIMYNMSFQTIQEGLMVFSDDFMHFLKIKKKLVEFTKTAGELFRVMTRATVTTITLELGLGLALGLGLG